MKSIILSICLFFSAVTFTVGAPPQTMPDFKFLKLDSTEFSRNDLSKDKKTLIVFFDATCGYCKKSIKQINSRYKELKKINIVLISLDEKKGIEMFMNENAPLLKKKNNVTILRDASYQFIPLFSPKRYPSIFLYSEQQELIIFINDDNRLEEVFKKIAE